MEFGSFATTLDTYMKELHELADGKRKQSDELAQLLDKKAFELAADPTRRVAPPQREPEVPYLNLAALDNAVARVKKSAKAYDAAYAALAARGTELSACAGCATQLAIARAGSDAHQHARLARTRVVSALHLCAGPVDRVWRKTMPGVREAIEENQWERANQFAVLTADVLTKYCERLDQATALLPAATSAPDGTRL